jgi:hypothetical protein
MLQAKTYLPLVSLTVSIIITMLGFISKLLIELFAAPPAPADASADPPTETNDTAPAGECNRR